MLLRVTAYQQISPFVSVVAPFASVFRLAEV